MTMRPAIALLLSLMLVVSGTAFAAARGAAAGGQTTVICSGPLIETIVLDARGVPVRQVQVCPDFGLGLFAAPPLPQPATAPAARLLARLDLPPAGCCHGRAAPPPLARGPPAAL
jgi:hypothetical protein